MVLFDRSGHRTKFTNVGRTLLERGRVLLEAADKLTTDAEALARGWETHLTIVTEALVPTPAFFLLIDKLAAKAIPNWQSSQKCWRGRGNGWSRAGGYRYRAGYAFSFLVGDQLAQALYVNERYVAAPDHPFIRSRNRYLK